MVVQVLLGVVLGQAVLRYGPVLADALDHRNRIEALAIASVFVLSLSSWLALTRRVSELPYSDRMLAGKIRFFADVGAVCVYAFLLLSVQEVTSPPRYGSGHLTTYMWSYATVFACYTTASFARVGQAAMAPVQGSSRPPRLWRAAITTGVMVVVATTYNVTVSRLSTGGVEHLNLGALLLVTSIVADFRLT